MRGPQRSSAGEVYHAVSSIKGVAPQLVVFTDPAQVRAPPLYLYPRVPRNGAGTACPVTVCGPFRRGRRVFRPGLWGSSNPKWQSFRPAPAAPEKNFAQIWSFLGREKLPPEKVPLFLKGGAQGPPPPPLDL